MNPSLLAAESGVGIATTMQHRANMAPSRASHETRTQS